jgi:hypothetical protein
MSADFAQRTLSADKHDTKTAEIKREFRLTRIFFSALGARLKA